MPLSVFIPAYYMYLILVQLCLERNNFFFVAVVIKQRKDICSGLKYTYVKYCFDIEM